MSIAKSGDWSGYFYFLIWQFNSHQSFILQTTWNLHAICLTLQLCKNVLHLFKLTLMMVYSIKYFLFCFKYNYTAYLQLWEKHYTTSDKYHVHIIELIFIWEKSIPLTMRYPQLICKRLHFFSLDGIWIYRKITNIL